MSLSPLVSILINNYNYGRFLRDAIDSALNQTYSNTEVIVVDDGSTDHSREIIASYANSIIPILKENGGQASAFNAGFSMSKGDIVCFLDSDDVWLPTKVEAVVEAISARDAGFAFHQYQRVDTNLVPLGKALPTTYLSGDVAKRVRQSGGCWSFPPTSALAFRRTILNSVMPIPEETFRTCADACLAYTAPLLGRVTAVKQPLCLYRIHGSNLYTNLTVRNKNRVQLNVERAERYRLCVEGANAVLARIGSQDRLCLDNHASYARATYNARISGGSSWALVSWKLARMTSEPSWLVRSKVLARFWVDSIKGHFS